MLTWIEMENATGYIGFDDDCPCYFVKQDEDGWYWEDSWGFGEGGYATAEEAKARAEADCPYAPLDPEEMGFTAEEIKEIMDEMEFERRREERMGW